MLSSGRPQRCCSLYIPRSLRTRPPRATKSGISTVLFWHVSLCLLAAQPQTENVRATTAALWRIKSREEGTGQDIGPGVPVKMEGCGQDVRRSTRNSSMMTKPEDALHHHACVKGGSCPLVLAGFPHAPVTHSSRPRHPAVRRALQSCPHPPLPLPPTRGRGPELAKLGRRRPLPISDKPALSACELHVHEHGGSQMKSPDD